MWTLQDAKNKISCAVGAAMAGAAIPRTSLAEHLPGFPGDDVARVQARSSDAGCGLAAALYRASCGDLGAVAAGSGAWRGRTDDRGRRLGAGSDGGDRQYQRLSPDQCSAGKSVMIHGLCPGFRGGLEIAGRIESLRPIKQDYRTQWRSQGCGAFYAMDWSKAPGRSRMMVLRPDIGRQTMAKAWRGPNPAVAIASPPPQQRGGEAEEQ